MDGWDAGLLVLAAYVAVVSLVRLMIRRRDQMFDEFRRKVRKQKRQKEAEQADRKSRRRRAA